MVELFNKVLDGAWAQLQYQVTHYVPSLLIAFLFLAVSFTLARSLRWLLNRIFKGRSFDKFLRQSGVAFLIDSKGRFRATMLVSEGVYWAVLTGGVLMSLSVFNTALTTRMIEGFLAFLPKLVVGAIILIAGRWLSVQLGRSTVVWAVGENIPAPRRLGAAVRLTVLFVAVVVVADHLDFARTVFLAAFIILVGGAVLSASLALGLGASAKVREFLVRPSSNGGKTAELETTLWNR